jgi:nucleotide-binding universal stress UspA family protein
MTTTNEKLLVLVPVDFSETSRRALAWAFDYATRAPCELHLLHVIDDQWFDVLRERLPDRASQEIWAVDKEVKEELERMVPSAESREEIGRIYHHVSRGRPAAEILRIAEKLEAEMIVMGTHGRSGLAHLLIGSVAEKIVRHANCPVVCVKPGTALQHDRAAI